MSYSCSLRKYKDGDEQGILELLKLVSKRNLSREWWNWKYRANPAGFWGEEGDIWVAESENKIVGHWAVIPEKIKIGSETLTVAQAVDAATHPDYRKLGIYKTLVKKVLSDIKDRYDFIFSFPVEVLAKSHIRHGWKEFKIVELINFLNYDRPLRNFSGNTLVIWSGKLSLKALRTLNYLSPSILFKKYRGNPVEIQKVNQFSSEMDKFWKKMRVENEVILERTTAFLNWRFSKYFGNYQIYIGRSLQHGSIVGYLVLKKTQVGRIQNVLSIVDLYALLGEEKLVLNFVDMAIRIAKNEELDMVYCRIPPWHRYAIILSKRGFVSINRLSRLVKKYQPRVTFYEFSKEGIIPKIQQWFYTLADTDYA